ncbi:MAG: ABC transporter permease [Alphaproteobacteria bacterium]|nr:ABC transporter permease [Alphaproteobacteria bacterium]
MFRNYLMVALRNARRNKLYTFITIAGLTVALTCAIFILMFLADELSYDQFIPGMNNVYQVDFAFNLPGHEIQRTGNSMFVLGPTMKAEIPQVAAYTHIDVTHLTLKADDRLFSMAVDVVDPDFFQVIHLPLVAGDASRVFAQPDSIVLSQKTAIKLFGSSSAIGKTVLVNAKHPMTVTGILKDLPHNSQLTADVLLPNTSKADPTPEFSKHHWENISPFLYVRLTPGTSPAHVVTLIRAMLDRHIHAQKDFGADIAGSQLMQPHLTRFTNVHLSSYQGGMTPAGSWAEVYGFAAIAGMILLIAGFNFTNLATARGMLRAREVSLRKVLGGRRSQLIFQFLGESVLTAGVALALSLALIELLTPIFDDFIGRTISLNYLSDWPLTLVIIAAALIAGLLGGVYPAVVLSGYRPAAALRTSRGGQTGSGLLRTALVVMQFAISIGLGIAALVVFAQVRHAREVNLGFSKSHIVVIRNAYAIPKTSRQDFVDTLATDPAISAAARSDSTPFEGNISLETVTVPGSPQKLSVRLWAVGPNYPKVYRTTLLAGRFLSANRAVDVFHNKASTANIVIDASAAQRFGYTPQEAIGKRLHMDKKVLTIVGVIGIQFLDGPQSQNYPTLFIGGDNSMGEISVRIKQGQTQAALAAIDRDWRRFAPNAAMNRYFLDDPFNRLFKASERRGRMFAVFVGIAIFIACLGLYGLAAYAAQRRTQEIGVRKVFGARTRDLVWLLLWQFSIPVLLANLIAWPVAWYYLSGWLEGFATRIALSPLYFIAAGLVALVIAWSTVSAHALRAARANPVQALHYE